MNTKIRNRLPHIYFAALAPFLLLNCISVAYAQSGSLLASRIQEYANLYPDIYFLHLKGGLKNTDINILSEHFGENAVNLDYEHDPIARNDLLQLQFMRINYLLNNRMPSATFFKTGKKATFSQPYVCVITLDESQFLSHPNASAEYMLGEPMLESLQGKDLSAFDNNTFLQYTLDHEVYHCLDAYLHGHSISKDTNELTGAYEHFLSEYRADLYASLIMRQSNSFAVEFLHLLASYRTMGLVDLDTEHYTVAAIRQVIQMPESKVRNTSILETVQNIRKLAQISKPGKTEYSQLITAASGLALYLGIENAKPTNKSNQENGMPTSPRLKLIIKEYEGARSYITSNLYLDDKQAFLH